MECQFFALNSLKSYKYVVILSQYKGRILLSKHRQRSTWETQGGHVETGETPLEAAKRELYEESGATRCQITSVFDYRVSGGNPDDNGMVFLAEIQALGPLPESEMERTALFDRLPDNLACPDITPARFRHAGLI